MKRSRVPPDAFDFYVGLGPERSYQAVADEFGVSKRAITRVATNEDWSGRLDKIERGAREKADERLQETLGEMNSRHLKMLRAVQGKAVEALRSLPMTSAMDAARAIDMTIKQERLVRGEPGDRMAHSVEEVIRREYEEWLAPADEEALDAGPE